ncbi:MAG TPA: MucB/RseB C-terminal domain-containing protein [Burkholderiaceae bacterium]|nr:MucB/RseB C-terminal domain-containing protein [Burkholderiaceae bacterium]
MHLPIPVRSSAYLRWFNTALCLSFVLALVAPAAQAQQGAGNSSDSRNELVWLAKIQQAALRQNYAGHFVYQQGASMQSSRIAHLVEGGNVYEKLEVLDGQPQEVIRKNDQVYCYIPGARTLLIERRPNPDQFPSLLLRPAAEVAEFYEVRLGGSERVAGVDCQMLTLRPRDAFRYGYRLWADRASGLLLKAQTLDTQGNVIEQIAFTQVRIGGSIDRKLLRTSIPSTEGWRVENADLGRTDPGLAQWQVKSVPPGFARTHEIVRSVGGRQQVGQIVYSDGLAAISIFIEPAASVPAGQREGTTVQGAVSVAMRKLGKHWLTVVGEVPMLSVRRVIGSIEYVASAPASPAVVR